MPSRTTGPTPRPAGADNRSLGTAGPTLLACEHP
jgi:hypothetical protein